MKGPTIERGSGSCSLHVKEKGIFIKRSVCNVLLTFCHYFGICLEILIMWLRTEKEAS